MRAISKRLIPLLVALTACTDAATSIQLSVQMPDPSGIDELAIVVESSRTLAPAATELVVLVPDDWAGAPIRIEVEGMASSTVVARGATDVLPERGQAITALVQLVGADCTTVCTPGDVRCEGDGVATCEMLGACPTWSAAGACPADAPFCSNGVCSSTCSDECATGALACDGTGAVRSCGNADADPCLDWISTACTSGEHCDAGACVPTAPACSTSTCSIAETTTDAVGAITSDGAYTYFVTADGVMRRSETTGTVETIEPRTIDLATVAGIVVDATHVYWTEGSAIKRTPKAGGTIQTFYSPSGVEFGHLAADATHVYWSERSSGRVVRKAKTGGTAEELAFTNATVGRFALDGTHLYFTDYEDGSDNGAHLYKVNKDGSGSIVKLLDLRIWAVAVDSTDIYIMSRDLGRLSKSGGAVDWFATGVSGIHLAADETHLIWMDDGALWLRDTTTGQHREIGLGLDEGPLALSPTSLAWSNATDLLVAPRCACEP